jgi:proton-translocating NADH-quinone oxidoreductase, chain N
MTASFWTNLLPSSPLAALVFLFFVLLAADLILPPERRRSLLWIAAGGLALIAVGTLLFMNQLVTGEPLWGGLLRLDGLGVSLIVLVCLGAALTAVFAADEPALADHGEFAALLTASAFGLALMAVSTDLVMLFLAMETASVPLYVLAGFMIYNRQSTEAGLKYLLYGGMASAMMAYGFSLIYGFSGSTHFAEIQAAFQSHPGQPVLLTLAFLFILVGFGYKIAAVPFHFWAPDVYQGSATAVSGFLSTASKAAGFAVLLRFSTLIFPALLPARGLVMALAIASMLLGNLVAMQQKNIKRLLAYSSIAQAGYLLIGVAAGTMDSTASVLYYLSGYLFSNLAAFALAAAAARQTGSDEIASYSGLSRRSPGLALMFLVAFLSLAGIPPFVGFAGKVFVFLSAARVGLTWLVVIGVLNSVIALYYYLNVIKVIYARPESEGQQAGNVGLPGSLKLALGVCMTAILVLGIIYLPWFNVLSQAGLTLWK